MLLCHYHEFSAQIISWQCWTCCTVKSCSGLFFGPTFSPWFVFQIYPHRIKCTDTNLIHAYSLWPSFDFLRSYYKIFQFVDLPNGFASLFADGARCGEHPDSRRKRVHQMIEHSNSCVAGWPKLKSSHLHLAEFMNPLLWQMTEACFSMHAGSCALTILEHSKTKTKNSSLFMGGFKAEKCILVKPYLHTSRL